MRDLKRYAAGAAFLLASLWSVAVTAQAPEEPSSEAGVALARSLHITVRAAEVALADTKAIGDYVKEHWETPNAPAVWVSYDHGYEVHARLPDNTSDATSIDALQEALGRAIVRHEGGAGLGKLNGAADFLNKNFPQSRFEVDVQDGIIALHDEVTIPDDVLSAKYVRLLPAPTHPDDHQLLIHAGHAWDGWNGTVYYAECTVGFTYKNNTTGYGGTATAAHCSDGYHQARTASVVSGYSFNAYNQSEWCDTRDVQLALSSTSDGVSYAFYNWTTNSHSIIYAIAGGYYIGQPTFMAGISSHGTWDQVLGFGTFTRPADVYSDCPNSSSIYGIEVGNDGQPGDSGGPILLIWGSNYYLAGTVSFGGSTHVVGYWTQNVPLPSAYHICTSVASC
jgi:hypothetical protein